MNLYLKENITELLNSTAFIYAKPIAQNFVSSSNKESNFLVNITINSTNVSNYNYIMQIIFDINYPLVNEEIISYSIEMNFTNILKNNETKKIDDDNNEKTLSITLISVVSVFIIISIIVFIYISKIRKKNKTLIDTILSFSFANNKSDFILNDISMHSKKDEEYESVFI